MSRCEAELELEGGSVFVCNRSKGHSLVHVDNRHALRVGVPAWSMVWANDQTGSNTPVDAAAAAVAVTVALSRRSR